VDADKEWWRTFFAGLVVEVWLRVMPEEQTRQEADFIERHLRMPPNGRILDAPCGGGRHSLALAARGYRLTGIDISAQFLQTARAAANEQQLAIDWREGDMRELPRTPQFDGAFCFGNSFGYYDDEGNAEFLRAIAAALKPGTRFVLDYGAVTEALLPAYQERSWGEFGDILFLRAGRYDHVGGRIHTEYTCIRGNQVEKKLASQRVYSYRELCRLLEEAGFADMQGLASLTDEPFHLGARRLLLIATKQGPGPHPTPETPSKPFGRAPAG
jgi:SAM-dependent methyltransferase